MTATLQAEPPELVLASASAARAALLRGAGLRFTVQAAAVDEAAVKQAGLAEGAAPADIALLLADLKAQRVAAARPDALVIGADQILVCDGTSYDKPNDPQSARQQLQALRGRTHALITAIVCRRHGRRAFQHVGRPQLTMRAVSDAFIDAYLAIEGSAVQQSVGAYRLEAAGIHLFERIEGEHSEILGLPLLPLLAFLRQHGAVMT